MKITTLIAATLLALSPSISMASCSWEHSTKEASSCADGMVWDAATESCTEQVTS